METSEISTSGLLADAIFGLGKRYCLLLNITQCHFHKCSLFVMLLQHNEREGEREGGRVPGFRFKTSETTQ